jgi:hypothetical protein
MSQREEIWLKGTLTPRVIVDVLGRIAVSAHDVAPRRRVWKRAAQRRAYAATLCKSSMILRRLALIS